MMIRRLARSNTALGDGGSAGIIVALAEVLS
jgi:hypothetical protein